MKVIFRFVVVVVIVVLLFSLVPVTMFVAVRVKSCLHDTITQT